MCKLWTLGIGVLCEREQLAIIHRGLVAMMALVHWGDTHMVDERGRSLLHEHRKCGKMFDPVMICSECREPLLPKEVHNHPGPGARKVAAAPKDEKLVGRKPRTKAA